MFLDFLFKIIYNFYMHQEMALDTNFLAKKIQNQLQNIKTS